MTALEDAFHSALRNQPVLIKGAIDSSVVKRYHSTELLMKLEYRRFLVSICNRLQSKTSAFEDCLDEFRALYNERERRTSLDKLSRIENGAFYNYSGYSADSNLGKMALAHIATLIKTMSVDNQTNIDSRIFVSPAGFEAGMHFDWRQMDNLLIQLDGKKKIVVVNPKDMHVSRGLLNTAVEFDTADREEYFLEPGDAFLIPAFYWHSTQSTNQTFSISLRFGNGLLTDVLKTLPPNWRLNQSLFKINYENEGLSILDRHDFKYTHEEQFLLDANKFLRRKIASGEFDYRV